MKIKCKKCKGKMTRRRNYPYGKKSEARINYFCRRCDKVYLIFLFSFLSLIFLFNSIETVSAVTFYADSSNAFCFIGTDASNKTIATNPATPYCNLNITGGALQFINTSDILIVKKGNGYNEGIEIPRGINGTASQPIIVMGEDPNDRTILRGTSAEEINGIDANGNEYWQFSNFYITNFSNDGVNLCSPTATSALNISFLNLSIINSGFSGSGDGISFHKNCTGIVRNVYIENVTKNGIIHIEGTKSWHYNVTVVNPGTVDPGIESSSDQALHGGMMYFENAIVRDSVMCFDVGGNFTAINLTCTNITGLSGNGATNRRGYTNITNWFYETTAGTTTLRTVSSANGLIIQNANIEGTSIIQLLAGYMRFINVSYEVNESVSASKTLNRSWWYEATTSPNEVDILLKNLADNTVLSATSSNSSISRIPVLEYVNAGGTVTYHTPHTRTASATGYSNSSAIINFSSTQNYADSIVLRVFTQTNEICEASALELFANVGLLGVILTITLVVVVIFVLANGFKNNYFSVANMKDIDWRSLLITGVVSFGLAGLVLTTVVLMLTESYCV